VVDATLIEEIVWVILSPVVVCDGLLESFGVNDRGVVQGTEERCEERAPTGKAVGCSAAESLLPQGTNRRKPRGERVSKGLPSSGDARAMLRNPGWRQADANEMTLCE